MFVFSFLAALVPQWIVTNNPASQSVGLFHSCSANSCADTVYPPLITSLPGGNACVRQGYELADRMRASAAMLIVAIILHFIVLVVTALAVNGKLLLSHCAWLAMTIMSILASMGILFATMIASITLNHWLFCNNTFCANIGATTDCGFGFSFVCSIVAIVSSAAVTVMLGLSLLGGSAQLHHNLRALSVLVSIGVIVVAVLAVATPHWFAWDQSRTSIGVFHSCVGATCQSNQLGQVGLFTTRAGCTISGRVLKARYDATGALLIIVAVAALAAAVLFLLMFLSILSVARSLEIVRIGTMIFIGGLAFTVVVAMILYGHTMNSYYYCGQAYCQGASGCGYGFSFAAAIITIILALLLLILHLFDHNGWWIFAGSGTAYTEPTATKTTVRTTTTTTTSSSSRTVTKKTGRTVLLPAGDWVYDRDSEYYWSEGRGLFWDPESEMFYNPDTEEWFS